jgi:hypothetical protein
LNDPQPVYRLHILRCATTFLRTSRRDGGVGLQKLDEELSHGRDGFARNDFVAVGTKVGRPSSAAFGGSPLAFACEASDSNAPSTAGDVATGWLAQLRHYVRLPTDKNPYTFRPDLLDAMAQFVGR